MNKVTLQSREVTSRSRIDSFIENAQIVRLGLISQGEPYVVPLNFIYCEGRVFFHCSTQGRKHKPLAEGSRVCLEFDEMLGVSNEKADTYYTSVIAWGTPEIIEDLETGRRVLEDLVDKYLETPRKITDTMVERTCIIGVRIEEVTGKENLV